MRFGSIMPFIEALTVCLFLTPLVRWMGIRLGIVDQPDEYRKFHSGAIPRCGGLAIYISFLVPIFVFFFLFKKESHLPSADHYRVWIIVIGSGIAMLMGLADDIWSIRVRWKILFQIIAATVAYSGNLRIESLTNPFGSPIELGFFSFPATVIWFFLCMNAINIFDGLDGLAAGVSLFVTLTLLGVSLAFGNDTGVFVSACLSGAILGFLVYNFNPATIFMGDSGSMFIGFGIAALGLVSSYKAEAATALLIPCLALLLPFFDLFSAALRRWSNYLPMTMPDGKHLHHVMMSKGLSARRTVVYLYIVCLILCSAALMTVFSRDIETALLVSCIGIIFLVGNNFLKVVDIREVKKRIFHDRQLHQWNKKNAIHLSNLVDNVKESDLLEDSWELCKPIFIALKLMKVDLNLKLKGEQKTYSWKSDISEGHPRNEDGGWEWSIDCPIDTRSKTDSSNLIITGNNNGNELRSIIPIIHNLTIALAEKMQPPNSKGASPF